MTDTASNEPPAGADPASLNFSERNLGVGINNGTEQVGSLPTYKYA